LAGEVGYRFAIDAVAFELYADRVAAG